MAEKLCELQKKSSNNGVIDLIAKGEYIHWTIAANSGTTGNTFPLNVSSGTGSSMLYCVNDSDNTITVTASAQYCNFHAIAIDNGVVSEIASATNSGQPFNVNVSGHDYVIIITSAGSVYTTTYAKS